MWSYNDCMMNGVRVLLLSVFCCVVALAEVVPTLPVEEVFARLNVEDAAGNMRISLAREGEYHCAAARLRVTNAAGTPMQVHAFPLSDRSHAQGCLGLELHTSAQDAALTVQGEVDLVRLGDATEHRYTVQRGQALRPDLPGVEVELVLEPATPRDAELYGSSMPATWLRLRYGSTDMRHLSGICVMDAAGEEVAACSRVCRSEGEVAYLLEGELQQCCVELDFHPVVERVTRAVSARVSLLGIEYLPVAPAQGLQPLPLHEHPCYFSEAPRRSTYTSGYYRTAGDRRPEQLPEGTPPAGVRYLEIELHPRGNTRYPLLVLRACFEARLFASRLQYMEVEELSLSMEGGEPLPFSRRLTEYEQALQQLGIRCEPDNSVRLSAHGLPTVEPLLLRGCVSAELLRSYWDAEPSTEELSIPFLLRFNLTGLLPTS